MQVLFSACLAAASASVPLVAYSNGAVAPAKTPEVLAAEAAHFAAKAAQTGYLPYAANFGYGFAPYAAGLYGAANIYGYNGYAAHPYAFPYYQPLVAYPNGAVVPADTPDVAAAKADHFAAHGAAYAAAPVAPYYAPGYAGLVAHANGALVPEEPADVVAARAEHLAAHASA